MRSRSCRPPLIRTEPIYRSRLFNLRTNSLTRRLTAPEYKSRREYCKPPHCNKVQRIKIYKMTTCAIEIWGQKPAGRQAPCCRPANVQHCSIFKLAGLGLIVHGAAVHSLRLIGKSLNPLNVFFPTFSPFWRQQRLHWQYTLCFLDKLFNKLLQLLPLHFKANQTQELSDVWTHWFRGSSPNNNDEIKNKVCSLETPECQSFH